MDLIHNAHLWEWALIIGAAAAVVLSPFWAALQLRLRKGSKTEQAAGELLFLAGSILGGSWSELEPLIRGALADGKVEHQELETIEREALAVFKRKVKQEVLDALKAKLPAAIRDTFEDVVKGVVAQTVRAQLPTAIQVPLAAAATFLPPGIQRALKVEVTKARP